MQDSLQLRLRFIVYVRLNRFLQLSCQCIFEQLLEHSEIRQGAAATFSVLSETLPNFSSRLVMFVPDIVNCLRAIYV